MPTETNNNDQIFAALRELGAATTAFAAVAEREWKADQEDYPKVLAEYLVAFNRWMTSLVALFDLFGDQKSVLLDIIKRGLPRTTKDDQQ